MESLQHLITEAADGTDIEVRSYSGRAMYGRECVAIVGDISELHALIANVLKEAHTTVYEAAIDANDDDEKDQADKESDAMFELIDQIMDYRTDSMGLSTVLYWPRLAWVEPEMTFEEWKAGIAEMMDISVAELIKRSEDIQDLKDAFDDGYTIEEAVNEYSK